MWWDLFSCFGVPMFLCQLIYVQPFSIPFDLIFQYFSSRRSCHICGYVQLIIFKHKLILCFCLVMPFQYLIPHNYSLFLFYFDELMVQYLNSLSSLTCTALTLSKFLQNKCSPFYSGMFLIILEHTLIFQ